jgi:hypothetical protein
LINLATEISLHAACMSSPMIRPKAKASRKRKAQEHSAVVATSIDNLPDGWIDTLVALGPNLAYVLGELANRALLN